MSLRTQNKNHFKFSILKGSLLDFNFLMFKLKHVFIHLLILKQIFDKTNSFIHFIYFFEKKILKISWLM